MIGLSAKLVRLGLKETDTCIRGIPEFVENPGY